MIDRVIGWFNRESSSITVAASTLGFASFLAAVLGLVRDRIFAVRFGASELLDIYYAGFRIPDLLLNLLILGAMSSAFLPVFAERYARDRDDAMRLSMNLLTLAAVALVGFALILFVAIPYLMPMIAPGFDEVKLARAVRVTRILLGSPILFGLSSIISAMLQYFRRFFLYSIAPILYNVGIIVGAIFLAPQFGERGLAGGVLIGAALYFAVQLPGLRGTGFRFRPFLLPLHRSIPEVLRLALPRTANLVVNQLQMTVLTAMASLYVVGSISVFNFSLNLASLPVSVIGVAFATAAFPVLARRAVASDTEGFARTLRETVQEIFFFTFPATALFIVLRAHLVRVLLNFPTWEDTRFTAAAFGAFSLGITAQALLPLLVRAFFARKDARTPLLIALVSSVLAIGGAFALSDALSSSEAFRIFFGELFRIADLSDIRIVALPLASGVAATVQVIILFAVLSGPVFSREEIRKLLASATRLALAALVGGAVSWLSLRPLAGGVAQETGIGILLQGFVAGLLGIFAYLVLTLLLAFPEARRLLALLRRSAPSFADVIADQERDSDRA